MVVLKEAFFGGLIAFVIVGTLFMIHDAMNKPRKTKEELLRQIKKKGKK